MFFMKIPVDGKIFSAKMYPMFMRNFLWKKYSAITIWFEDRSFSKKLEMSRVLWKFDYAPKLDHFSFHRKPLKKLLHKGILDSVEALKIKELNLDVCIYLIHWEAEFNSFLFVPSNSRPFYSSWKLSSIQLVKRRKCLQWWAALSNLLFECNLTKPLPSRCLC